MKLKNFRRNVKAISPLIATLLLIGITVVGGLIVYGLFFSMTGTMGTTLSIQATTLDLVKAGDTILYSASIKNIGNKYISNISVAIGPGDTGLAYSRDWNDGLVHQEEWDINPDAVVTNPENYLRIASISGPYVYPTLTSKKTPETLSDIRIVYKYRFLGGGWLHDDCTVGIFFRTGYHFYQRNSDGKFALKGGSTTVIVGPYPVNTWYNITITAIGNKIKVWINNELKIDVTDSTYASGKIGFTGWSAACDIDDLSIYDERTAGDTLSLSMTNISPGMVMTASTTDIAKAYQFKIGQNYIVKITVMAADGSSIVKSMTVRCTS